MPDEPVSLPGLPSMVAHAGSEARRILAATPRADDGAAVAEAFAALAVHHSASGDAGGSFGVLVQVHPGRARVEVSDAGERAAPADEPRFSFLLGVVDRLADAWGHERTPDGSRWWADFMWGADEERDDG